MIDLESLICILCTSDIIFIMIIGYLFGKRFYRSKNNKIQELFNDGFYKISTNNVQNLQSYDFLEIKTIDGISHVCPSYLALNFTIYKKLEIYCRPVKFNAQKRVFEPF